MSITVSEEKIDARVVSDSVALLGENRRLLLLSLDQIPRLKKGRGVTLQKYKNGQLQSARLFNRASGLYWQKLDRKVYLENQQIWFDKRGKEGKLALNLLWID